MAIQNEDIERMQNLLQNKDDEIDKLREALDEEEEGDTVCFSLKGSDHRKKIGF